MISDNLQGVLNGQPEEKQQPQQSKGGNNLQDLLTSWVRGSYMIAALSPQDVRDQMTTANEAFSGMLEHATGNRREPALTARKQWEQAATLALQANRQRLIDYGLIWANEDMGVEDKMSHLREAASQRGDMQVANVASSPEQFTTFGQYYDIMSKQQQDAESATQSLDEAIKQIEAKLPPAKGGNGGGNGNGAPPIDMPADGWEL